jgi:putative peptidoglycan lipid II flippase
MVERDEPVSLASVGRGAAVVTGGVLLAQLTVVLRELFLAAQVGVSAELDTLLVGILLPVALGTVLTSGTVVALVPPYLATRSRAGVIEAKRFAGNILILVGVASCLLWLAVVALAPAIVSVAGSGLGPEQQAQAVHYLRLASPSILIQGICGILLGVCQAEDAFGTIAASTIAVGAGSLAGMLVLWPSFGMASYAIGMVIGSIAGLIVAIALMKPRAILPRPVFIPRDERLRPYLDHASPLVLSTLIMQLVAVTDIAVATHLAPGAVSALRFGVLLVNVPIGAIGLGWAKAFYPAVVKSTLEPGGSRMGHVTVMGLTYALAVFIPLAMLVAATAPVVVSAAYARGAFSGADAELTALVVLGLSPMIAIAMIIPVLSGSLNALRKGRILLAGGILHVGLTLVLDITLAAVLGVMGIALATSITNALIAVFFGFMLVRAEPTFRPELVWRTVGIAIAAAAPAVIVIAALAWSQPPPSETFVALAFLVAAGLAVAGTYLWLSRRLGLLEPATIVGALLSTIRRATGLRRALP